MITILVAAAFLVVVFCLLGPFGASADQMGIEDNGPSGDYDFGSSNCEGDKSDPVGVIFRGKHAGPPNVSTSITDYTGWGFTENGHTQSLLVHQLDGSYKCQVDNASNAEHDEKLPEGRFHVRLWFVPGSTAGTEVKTVGTPHHEDWHLHNPTPFGDQDHCLGAIHFKGEGIGNHFVNEGGVHQGKESGFDRGREELRRKFEAHDYKAETEYWGNTAEFEQCTEDMAGSNGSGIIIYMERALHPWTWKSSFVRSTTSQLNGQLISEEPGEWWFGYGPTSSQGPTGYPSKTPVRSISGPVEMNISESVSGLTPNTTYYARLFARNQSGEVEEGPEVQYATCIPLVTGDDDDNTGGPRATNQCGGEVDTFYRDTAGNLGHQWYVPGTGWSSETAPAKIAPTAVPRAVSRSNGTGIVDVFYRDVNGNLGHQWHDVFKGWQSETLEASLSSEPHVLSQLNGMVDVAYRDTDGNLGFQTWTPGVGWKTETVPATMASEPHLVGQPSGVVDVFYRDTAGKLGHQNFTPGKGWTGETIEAVMASDPYVVTQPNGSGVVDVFYRDTAGKLGHQNFTPGKGWTSETRTASIAASAVPRVVTQSSGVIDVFYHDSSGKLGHQTYTPGKGWTTETRAASMASDPHVIGQPNGSGTLDVFYREPSGSLGRQRYVPGTGWTTETRAASMASDPHVLAQPIGGGLDVFYRDTTGNLGHQAWNPTAGWTTETRTASIAPRPPLVSSHPVGGRGETEATAGGGVNPEYSPTTYVIEYGKTTAYGTKKPVPGGEVGYGGAEASVSQVLPGLEPETTYHYRTVATNPEGTSYSPDLSFTTLGRFAALREGWGSLGSGDAQFASPAGIATDAAGNVWVADRGNARVEQFDSEGRFLRKFGSKGSAVGQIGEPVGIAVGNEGGTTVIYVADAANHRVEAFGESGNLRFQLGESASEGHPALVRPAAVGAGTGGIWVSDVSRNRLVEFSPSGKVLLELGTGTGGAGPTEFSSPQGLAVDTSGNLWVADTLNNRIEEFDPNGVPLVTLGTKGSAEGQLSEPDGIAFEPLGHLLVSEKGNRRIQELSRTGEWLRIFGKKGSETGELETPKGIAIGPNQVISVIDESRNRVEQWTQLGGGPSASSFHVSGACSTSCVLAAKVTPHGLATTYRFSWGTTYVVERRTLCKEEGSVEGKAGEGFVPVEVQGTATLKPGVENCISIKATNRESSSTVSSRVTPSS